MRTTLLEILACPDCSTEFKVEAAPICDEDVVESGLLACLRGHRFPVMDGVPRFVSHRLDPAQARSRDSFGYEWTRLYPTHGHDPTVQTEREVFLEYTRTIPSDFRGKLVLDAGCGNGRYARIASDWGARVVAVEISDAVDVAARNLAGRKAVDVVQADLFKLPFRDWVFDAAYGVGVLHHTPDARGAFEAVARTVRPGGWVAIFVHGRGNRVLYAMNRLLRRLTSRAPYRVTWWFCLGLTGLGNALTRIPFVGPLLYLVLRQVLFFSPDQHNNFDHYSAGFTSFHRREEVMEWYRGWEDVVVRWAGVACESIYARGTKSDRRLGLTPPRSREHSH